MSQRNLRTLSVVLTVASAMVAVALVAQVDGFVVSPALRFYLTVGQAGLTAAVAALPSALRRRPGRPPRGG